MGYMKKKYTELDDKRRAKNRFTEPPEIFDFDLREFFEKREKKNGYVHH